MNSNEKDQSKKQLIFDSFVALDRQDQLWMAFSGDPEEQTRSDLSALLEEMNYLGRSESWVSVRLNGSLPTEDWDCLPVESAPDSMHFESGKLACVLPKTEYENLGYHDKVSWFEALCMSTKDLLREGWSSAPALNWVDYARKTNKFNVIKPSRAKYQSKREYRCFKYAVHSSVRPRVQETALFAERIRTKLMGIHRKIQGDNPEQVSHKFSGKTYDGTPLEGHKHAFFLPVDEDNDGRIDHLLITADEPFESTELMALDRLRSIWQSHGKPDASLILTSMQEDPRPKTARTWVSVTPFVTARHHRKGRGPYWDWLSSEVKRECEYHGLPKPETVNWIRWTMTGSKPIRWMEFARGKKNERPFRGHGCILQFNEPVAGPFALGARSHFGLGLFHPLE
jgi:CRISPR-associated protein Csb2